MVNSIKSFLNLENFNSIPNYRILSLFEGDGYKRQLIEYESPDRDMIRAFLFLPIRDFAGSAVVLHHQHNSGRRYGKSEIAGLIGDPLQAFGPALARSGVVALAPDSICFEDRRRKEFWSETDDEPGAFQHFLEMSYRLIQGDTLMRKILADASLATSILCELPGIDKNRIGVAGHSMGGNTALFQAAVDQRIKFICCSGALASFSGKMSAETGLEMALIIPKFLAQFDMIDVVKSICPRLLMIVSATNDKYSFDADEIVEKASVCSDSDRSLITHYRVVGEHELDQDRFKAIQSWLCAR